MAKNVDIYYFYYLKKDPAYLSKLEVMRELCSCKWFGVGQWK